MAGRPDPDVAGIAGPSTARPSARSDAIVTVRDVSYRYDRAQSNALDGVAFDVMPGSVVAIAGANGSGKTTLAKLMVGLLHPRSGSVAVDGLDTRVHDVRALAAHAGFAFQNPGHQLFAATVADELAFGPRNLGVGAPETAARTAAVAATLGLGDLLHEHPRRLGLAQRRLVAIGSVLVMHPPLLVLDEPTTGQDARAAARLVRLMGELRAGGTTIVTVTHDMRFVAEVADRLLVLGAGRLMADESPRAAFADPALIARAGIVPPQITRLSLRLTADRPAGHGAAAGRAGPGPALTVGELVSALASRPPAGREAGS